jgi:hypothetical protein
MATGTQARSTAKAEERRSAFMVKEIVTSFVFLWRSENQSTGFLAGFESIAVPIQPETLRSRAQPL